MTYLNLNDAVVTTLALAPGATKIWYFKNEVARDMMMGYNFCEKHGLLPKINSLEATHVLLGSIASTSFEQIYQVMQGEYWSPEGEARTILAPLGLGHTSMSMGDIIEIDGAFFIVDSFGFRELY